MTPSSLPPSCSVADLDVWLDATVRAKYAVGLSGPYRAILSHAVRALVEAKVRETVMDTDIAIGLKTGETSDSIVSSILGAP